MHFHAHSYAKDCLGLKLVQNVPFPAHQLPCPKSMFGGIVDANMYFTLPHGARHAAAQNRLPRLPAATIDGHRLQSQRNLGGPAADFNTTIRCSVDTDVAARARISTSTVANATRRPIAEKNGPTSISIAVGRTGRVGFEVRCSSWWWCRVIQFRRRPVLSLGSEWSSGLV